MSAESIIKVPDNDSFEVDLSKLKSIIFPNYYSLDNVYYMAKDCVISIPISLQLKNSSKETAIILSATCHLPGNVNIVKKMSIDVETFVTQFFNAFSQDKGVHELEIVESSIERLTSLIEEDIHKLNTYLLNNHIYSIDAFMLHDKQIIGIAKTLQVEYNQQNITMNIKLLNPEGIYDTSYNDDSKFDMDLFLMDHKKHNILIGIKCSIKHMDAVSVKLEKEKISLFSSVDYKDKIKFILDNYESASKYFEELARKKREEKEVNELWTI